MHALHLAGENVQLRLVLPWALAFIHAAFTCAAAASFAASSEYLEGVQLGVDSSDAKARTPDRVCSGFEPITRSKIADGGHHPNGDARRHTVANVAIRRLPHLSQ